MLLCYKTRQAKASPAEGKVWSSCFKRKTGGRIAEEENLGLHEASGDSSFTKSPEFLFKFN